MEGDKPEQKEEEKGQQIDSSSKPKTTDQKIKELEAKLPNTKFTHEDKEKLRDIFENSGDQMNDRITEFLKDLKERQTSYLAKREFKKIAPLYDTHDFWDSQPVPKETDSVESGDFDKPIDVIKTVDEIRAEPLDIPAGFHWSNVNVEDDNEAQEVYDLLTQNYVEDDDNMFRFD